MNADDTALAKNRIKQLSQFYGNMPCLLDIARAERFEWTVEDLQELLRAGVPHHIVSGVMALYIFFCTLQNTFGPEVWT